MLQNMNNISTKSDLINFIIFKRTLRRQLQRFLQISAVIAVIIMFCLAMYYKNTLINVAFSLKESYNQFISQILFTKITRVRVHVDSDSLIPKNEISDIVAKVSGVKMDKLKMKQIIADVIANNPLIENLYMRQTLASGELVIYLKERPVIGVFYHDDCANGLAVCQKNIITSDNQLLKYYPIIDNNRVLKVYGKIGTVDIAKIYNIFKKYSLLDKIMYIKFYASGRFDVTLKNKLQIKFPRTNFLKSVQQFVRLDSEYLLSTDVQSIRYIDLRVDDRVFIGRV